MRRIAHAGRRPELWGPLASHDVVRDRSCVGGCGRREVEVTGADTKFEDRVVISGIGQSAIGRRLGRSPLALTLDAITAALADAGLAPGDVGGLAAYPGGGSALGPGFAGPALTWPVVP